MSYRLILASAIAFVLIPATASAIDPAPVPPVPRKEAEPPTDRQLLERVGVDIAPAGLVELFRSRTLLPEMRGELAAQIVRLGSEEFEEREAATGVLREKLALAIPLLRSASADPDPEIVRRAASLASLGKLSVDTPHLLAAARLIAADAPANAVAVLLEYLPSAGEEMTLIDEILRTVGAIVRKAGKPEDAILKGLTGNDPLARRRIAGVLFAALPSERSRVKTLLRDPDAGVRRAVAAEFFEIRDRDAVPVFIELLLEPAREISAVAEDQLCRLLGTAPVPAPLGSTPESRRLCRDAWAKWWQTAGPSVDLAKSLDTEALRGITLISEMDLNKNFQSGRIFEVGPDGKQIREFKTTSAIMDVQRLPGGRLLLAEWVSRQVREYDWTGKVVWESPAVPSNPLFGYRLPGGNTLIGYDGGLVEYTPDKKPVGTWPKVQGLKHCVRTKSGTLFVLTSTDVIEFDASRKEVRRIAHRMPIGGWGGLELMANGHFVIADTVNNTVVEIDGQGKSVWQHTSTNPRRTQRLPNGNILIGTVSGRAAIEIDRSGKEVSRIPAQGGVYGLIRY